MSFIMYAAGSTMTGSRLRSVSARALLLGAGLVSTGLLAAGAGLGVWISAPQPAAPALPSAHAAAAPERPRSVLPFAVEQLGALSGRLFKLESQAGQLSERLGAMQGSASKPAAQPRAARPVGSGGPLLLPRAGQDTPDGLGAVEERIAEIE